MNTPLHILIWMIVVISNQKVLYFELSESNLHGQLERYVLATMTEPLAHLSVGHSTAGQFHL